MSVSFSFSSSVRGYHVYKDIWEATEGEVLPCSRELHNLMDPFAVAIKKDDIMHLSICCPTLPLLGCTGGLPGDLTQDFPPGVGNLTVKSLMLPRGSIEM